MAELNRTYERRSIRRVSHVLSQINPCSPLGDTTRHNGRPSVGNPATQPGDTSRPEEVLEFLDYYREGKEFYDQLLLRVETSLRSTADYVTRIEFIVNNRNLNINKVPDKYKQTLSLQSPVSPEAASLLRTQFHSRTQSEVAQKRRLIHTSETAARQLTARRNQLRELTRYIDSINRTLGGREEDPMYLFRHLKEQYGTRTGTNL